MIAIHTNNVPRPVLYGYELTVAERAELDYLSDEEISERNFARYRGNIHDIGDFVTTSPGPWNFGLPSEFEGWDGYQSDSFFSGILVRYVDDNEAVVMGWYSS